MLGSTTHLISSKLTTAIVIDDDEDTVDVFCDYLEIKHVDVLGRGHDGKMAVDLYQKYKPDIVFLDIMMPEYDGFYALENIRKIDPESKVVVITADLRADSEMRLNMLKPTEILIKPFEIEKITKLLEKL